jgi:Brp/Blh family beta-carotene 15,15'-monooxygenase
LTDAAGSDGGRLVRADLAFGLASLGLLACRLAGLSLESPAVVAALAVAILAAGLPHGSLDLARFGDQALGARGRRALLGLYLLTGAAMGACWAIAPAVALAGFLVLSAFHFGEDWEGVPAPARIVCGWAPMAVASLFHHGAVTAIFIDLAGAQVGRVCSDLLLMTAPVAGLVALAAFAGLALRGRRRDALRGGLVLLTLAVLPPVAGFASYFCLCHSPRQLLAAISEVPGARLRWMRAAVPISLLAYGLAVVIWSAWSLRLGRTPRLALAALLPASFVTLSVLTLPHMAAPLLHRLAALRDRPWPTPSIRPRLDLA